jgi:hypothetical protein
MSLGLVPVRPKILRLVAFQFALQSTAIDHPFAARTSACCIDNIACAITNRSDTANDNDDARRRDATRQ